MTQAPSLSPVDPVALTQALVRCASITPRDEGALGVLAEVLRGAGFEVFAVDRGVTRNIFARFGAKGAARSFGFNGHTDVVPPGNAADWTHPPFDGAIVDGRLYGRGACDMKSGVAAFVAAAVDFVHETPPDGAVIVAITGDEEGEATDGTVALLDWMAERGEAMTHCLVGEPTCPAEMGEMMKNGRRGSLTVHFVAQGVQGHAAYPHRARNPLHALVTLLGRLTDQPLDTGNALFDPSTLAITTIDSGNPASNVIPASARATVNIRFNDLHTGAGLIARIEAMAAEVERDTGVTLRVEGKISGESFVTAPGAFTDLVADAVEAECGRRPVLSTSGGTSDARFIKNHCPVVEFGLVGQSMHKVDEHVELAHVHQLKAVYRRILNAYFA